MVPAARAAGTAGLTVRSHPSIRVFPRCVLLLLGLASGAACAERGRLLATGGATQFEGAAGGGLVPWAVLSGYATRDGTGGTAFATQLDSGDYRLAAAGAAWTWRNRLELSLARQRFELPTLRRRLQLPEDRFDLQVIGAKVRLAGDVVYGRGPQLSLGVQHKRHRDFAIPRAIGARSDRGSDVYLSATRLWLAGPFGRNLLLAGTLRSTRANQAGLLGFGGDRRRGRSLVAEASAALLLDRHWAIGVEYRQKPDNLGFAAEHDWRDVFVAWFPDKRVALTAAWVDLGAVASLPGQRAWYLSVQVSP